MIQPLQSIAIILVMISVLVKKNVLAQQGTKQQMIFIQTSDSPCHLTFH